MRVKLRIKDDVQLYGDASLSKVSESLLGDKLITLNAGQDIRNPMKDGGLILDKNVHEGTEMSAVFDKLDQITSNINDVTVSLKKMIGNMEREDALGGVMTRMNEIADNVAQLTQRVNDTVIRGSKQIDRILADVAGVTSGTRERYNEILDNVTVVSGDVRKLVKNVNDIIGQGEEDWKESVGGIKESLEKVNRSLENLSVPDAERIARAVRKMVD